MARLRQRDTGSVINVPDEKADAMAAMGDYEIVQDSSSAKKATSKKTSSSKSSS